MVKRLLYAIAEDNEGLSAIACLWGGVRSLWGNWKCDSEALLQADRLFVRRSPIAQKCNKFLFLAIANPPIFNIPEIRRF